MNFWFYVAGTEKRGPITEDEIVTLIRAKELSKDTLVWTKGFEAWKPSVETTLRIHFESPDQNPVPKDLWPPGHASSRGEVHPMREGSINAETKIWFWEVFTFQGRIRRAPYFLRHLLIWLSPFILLGAAQVIVNFNDDVLTFFSVVIFALCAYLSFANAAKRWHDFGRSGWWSITLCIPYLGIIPALILLFKKGDDHENSFGPPYNRL